MPGNNPIIRDSAKADISRIRDIYARSVREDTASFEFEPPDRQEMLRRRSVVVEAGYPYLVAEVDGRVEGYAHAGPFHARPGYAPTVENTVYVSAEAQGRGVGRALMEKLIEQCAAQGYRQMIAVIGGSERDISIGFHKSLGFVLAGTLRSVGYKHEGWRDVVMLQLPLGQGDKTRP